MKKFLKENWFLILVIIYVISPVDLFPEILVPIFGYVDDVGLLIFEFIRRLLGMRKKAINANEQEFLNEAKSLR